MRKFLDGNISLVKSYWIFGVIGSIVLSLLSTVLVANNIIDLFTSLIINNIYFLGIWIGVWSSANKYQGFILWKILAKSAIILGILIRMAEWNVYLEQTKISA
jgi:hypothetical protein